MSSETDSDSDIEALQQLFRAKRLRTQEPGPDATRLTHPAHQTPTPAPPKPPQPPAKLVESEEYLIKIGENAILRSKLEKIAAQNQQQIRAVVAQYKQQELAYKDEVEKFRNLYETEKSLHMLLIGDRNLNIQKNSRPNLPTIRTNSDPNATVNAIAMPTTPAPSTISSNSTGNGTRAKPNTHFSDGFVVDKLPKAVSQALSAAVPAASTALASSHLVAAVASSLENSDQKLLEETSVLVSFLLAHHTPGFKEQTIQLLFAVPDRAKVSVGHDLLKTLTLAELTLKLVQLVNQGSLANDETAIYLSLLYEAQFVGLSLAESEARHTVPKLLCTLLLQWFEQLKLLPQFNELDAMCLVRLEDVRCLTYIMYALDVLLAADWTFEVPEELTYRILECLAVPQIRARGYDLFTKYPNSELHSMVFYEFSVEPAPGNMELIFGGLRDPPSLTAAELAARSPCNSKCGRLVLKLSELNTLKMLAKLRAQQVFEYTQLSSVEMAYALIPVTKSMQKPDHHVLALLQYSVDGYAFDSRCAKLVEVCVFYFWRRTSLALRDTLHGNEAVDLCVCLTKVLVDENSGDKNMVNQARTVLQAVAPYAKYDIDGMMSAFEAPEN